MLVGFDGVLRLAPCVRAFEGVCQEFQRAFSIHIASCSRVYSQANTGSNTLPARLAQQVEARVQDVQGSMDKLTSCTQAWI